jgi:hypothetical protein
VQTQKRQGISITLKNDLFEKCQYKAAILANPFFFPLLIGMQLTIKLFGNNLD